MFCEEFDDRGPVVTTGKTKKSAKTDAATATPIKSKNVNKRRGLCVNCRHCDTCTFPIVEGGVWHCEEYE